MACTPVSTSMLQPQNWENLSEGEKWFKTIIMLKTVQINKKYSEEVENLLHELADYPEIALNRKPAPGSWSALQTAWHLVLAEEGSMRYVRKKLHYGGTFKRTGFQEFVRFLILDSGLRLPIKYNAPEVTSGASLPEYSTLKELSERWRSIRSEWTDFFSQLPENLEDKAVFKHHVVGRIGWNQMLQFFRTHFKRHRRQIRKALV